MSYRPKFSNITIGPIECDRCWSLIRPDKLGLHLIWHDKTEKTPDEETSEE